MKNVCLILPFRNQAIRNKEKFKELWSTKVGKIRHQVDEF